MPSVRARQLCPDAIFLSGSPRPLRGGERRVAQDPARRHADDRADRARRGVRGRRRRGAPARAARRHRARTSPPRTRRARTWPARSGSAAPRCWPSWPRGRRSHGRAGPGLVPGPGVYLVEPADELDFLHGHAVEALWGVGPATAKRLHDLGVRTVGDLAALPLDTMVAPARQGEWRAPGRARPWRGSRSGQPEPTEQVDRARGDLQPGPGRPARAGAPRAAHGRIGGDHVARRRDLGPDDHGEGEVQGPVAAVPLAHARASDRDGRRHRAGGCGAAGRDRPRRGHPPPRGERLGPELGRGRPALVRPRGRARRGQPECGGA